MNKFKEMFDSQSKAVRIVSVLVAIVIVVAVFANRVPTNQAEVEETPNKEEKEVTETTDDKDKTDKDKAEKEEKEDDEEEEDLTWDDLKDKDRIVGKSDKDYKEVSESKASDVRNDSTGNWKKSKFAESVDIEEYLLSYEELHMEEGEIHFIINFNYNTTTVVNKMNGVLYVDIHEYEKKEEHEADKIGSGMLLKSYVIYPDGDIEELEEL